MNVNEQLQKISKKSGADMAELKTAYVEVLKNTPPGLQQEYKALVEVNKAFGGGRSPAVAFEAIILNIGSLFDYNKKKIAAGLEAYSENSTTAIESGLVKLDDKDNPIVMDTLEVFSTGTKNDNFGKELKNSYNRNCIILIKEEGKYIPSTLALRNKLARENLPSTNCLLKFRALGNSKEGLRSSDVATKYETTEVISNEAINSLIMTHFDSHVKMLGDCLEYHKSFKEKTPEFYNRFVITSGTVVYTKEGEDDKNHFIILDDPTVDAAVCGFVDNNIPLPEQGSDITVIAQTVLGNKWDTEKKEQIDEEALQLNVSGIIPA